MKKILFYTFLFLFTGLTYCQGYQFDWANQLNNVNSTAEYNCLTTDGSENVISGGFFKEQLDFDPGPGIQLLSPLNASAGFLQKMTANKVLIWANQIDVTGSLSMYTVATDQNDNIICSGIFTGQIDLDPGTGTQYATSNGNGDIFIIKLDPNGSFIWGKTMGADDTEFCLNMEVDTSGNTFISGYYTYPFDADPGPGIALTPYNNSFDVFIAKYDTNGDYQWVKTINGDGADFAMNSTLDENQNIWICGKFSDTVDFDPGPGVLFLQNPVVNNEDGFLLKLNQNGELAFAQNYGGKGGDIVTAVHSAPGGYILLSGEFKDTVDFDTGAGVHQIVATVNQPWQTNPFIMKIDTTGNFQWLNTWPEITINGALEMEVGIDNHVFAQGIFTGTVDFNPGAGVLNETPMGNPSYYNEYFLELDSNGIFQTVRPLGNSASGVNHIYELHISESYDMYYCGFMNSVPMDVDPGPNNYNISPIGSNGDGCLVKLSSCSPSETIDSVFECLPFTWINGQTFLADTSGIKHVFLGVAQNGCDSIVTLELIGIQSLNTDLIDDDTSITALTNGVQYQWLDCQNGYSILNGENNQTYIPDINGAYAVQLISSSCIDTSDCVIIDQLEIEQLNNKYLVSIYPNPAAGKLNVSSLELIRSITLYDLSGRKITVYEEIQNNFFEIYLELSSGSYIVDVELINLNHFKELVYFD